MLGALPVVADFCRRLRIAEIVDGLCPVRDVAPLTHGQVVEALIANRLTSPSPMVGVEGWAAGWGVEDILGICPDELNDDRLGRALDALAPRLDTIVGTVGATAIEVFGIDTARMHWDMTSMSLYGTYRDVDETAAAPGFGHPKDRRTDLRQIQVGLAVAHDGGVPVLSRVLDGGAGEVAQVVPAMRALQKMAGPARMLIVGDSKLVSYANLAAMDVDGVTFIAPASKMYVSAEELAACRLEETVEVDYVAERDAGKAPDRRGRWRVVEDTMSLAGPRKRDPVLRLRRVFVHSSARAEGAVASRERKLVRARDDLDRLTRGLGGRYYPDEAAVVARLTRIANARRVGAYLRTRVGTNPENGKPTLDWSFDQGALDAEAATDGWYALLTNLDPVEADAAEVLRRFKGQEAVERRYQAFKGPLAVTPVFLRSNQRIAALLTVICLALLIFCLVEREVRRQIAPEVKLDGLYVGRPAKPTGRLIFEALAGLRIVPGHDGQPAVIPRPPRLQLRLLDLLGVDPLRRRPG
jgi:transposase